MKKCEHFKEFNGDCIHYREYVSFFGSERYCKLFKKPVYMIRNCPHSANWKGD
jgi:hypothetical protein